LEAVRRSPRIHKAYAQLWGTADLLVTTDRCGFNPPERGAWAFPGPHLHWDVPAVPPVAFGTQGLVYLTDTAVNGGAFVCAAGFHRRIDDWLASDPARQHVNPPRDEQLVGRPVPGRAGDLIIWHQALPHGSSPNRNTSPRIVEYVNLLPPYS
jgi:ectoine hydroxylase-related dioxygenase (phytanoyl-CoA dioxygenase family)